jgi:hypothetical protein
MEEKQHRNLFQGVNMIVKEIATPTLKPQSLNRQISVHSRSKLQIFH